MFIKRVAFPILIASSLFLNDCKNNKKETINLRENTKETKIKLKNNLENIIILNSTKIVPETVNNNEYLLSHIENKSYLHNEDYLRTKINKFIEYSEHVYVEKDTDNTVFYKIPELTLGQLQRIYLMYEYLNDTSCLQEMGKIIEDDVSDKYAEHGGIIIFNEKNELHFKTLESYEPKTRNNNRFYGPPDTTFTTPSVAKFHLHAEDYDEEDSANPSSVDLIISDYTTDSDNESNDFVISPIKRGIFNIDYYGREVSQKFFTKILDLGKFSYDTTKIK